MVSVYEERLSDVGEGAREGEFSEESLVRSGVGEMEGRFDENLGADHPEHVDSMVERESGCGEPLRWPRRIRAGRARVEDREELIEFSDLLHERLTQDGVRMAIQCRDAPLEIFGRQHVVVSGPLEVLSRRQLESQIEICRRAKITIIAIVPDPGVRCRVLAADDIRSVGCGIVRDD